MFRFFQWLWFACLEECRSGWLLGCFLLFVFGCFWGVLVVLHFVSAAFFCYLVGGWLCCSLGVLIVFGGFVLIAFRVFSFCVGLAFGLGCSFALISLFSSWCSFSIGLVEPFNYGKKRFFQLNLKLW